MLRYWCYLIVSLKKTAIEDCTALIYTATRHLKSHVKEAILNAGERSKPSVRQLVERSKYFS